MYLADYHTHSDCSPDGRETIARWPKFYREDLGADIKKTMREMLRLATKARLKYYSKTTLQELDTEKEILNAIYFNGIWQEKFDAKNTRLENFSGYTRIDFKINIF